ncbi:hypothetical protein Pla108_42020 [Botrimarina colliarenosi]|uniref:Uncharacterized protein n=1 Tax=Botrimarina colliarenosi TaxID=2528001 RepID=A0A5C5ZWW4_9BACT|nr:hypothetical protein [Botrimarina colliarenosi]TWT91719.1 hypothetical protein Pla108_42020 [Botrimarina colliarenosi]
MAAVDELPNDVEALKRLLLEEREQRQAAIDAAVDEAVKAAVAAILRRYYGPVIGSRKVQRPAGPGGARIVQRAAVPSEPLAGS